jgi:chitinase
MHRRSGWLLAFTLAWAGAATATTLPKRLIGDYGFWSRTQTPPYSSAQIPFNKLTHINHAGVSFAADASLLVPDGFLEPELIQRAHAAGVKVLLLLGGDFPAISANPALIPVLVGNLQTFLTHYHYDGVDIDWEYPESSADRSAFIALFQQMRAVFPAPAYVLSAYVAPWGGSGYGLPDVLPSLDYLSILMYDCAGPWTDDGQLNSAIFPDPRNPQPYECAPGGTVEHAADIFLLDYHVPPAQLNMGTPFYGYLYGTVDSLYGNCDPACTNTNVPSENYGTFIKQRVNQLGWTSYVDPYAQVPYLLRTDGGPGYITYDDPTSTYKRVYYSLWQRGLGGTFMWSLDADYDGHSQDLLDAMYAATTAQ